MIHYVFLFCFLSVIVFEFVNGFHDTANAVATVIYTKTLRPYYAVVWSGICNFLGVFLLGTAVAMSIVKLIPIDALMALPTQVGAAVAISVLLGSILWNLGTWYLGIPLSSTHTLIGAMIGASLGFTQFYGGPGVDWGQAIPIGLSLLISPIIGFGCAALLMFLEKKVIKSSRFFHVPEGDEDKPPLPIRILLVTTCTLVSFFHGSNDGQKGVGLLMLILVIFLPASFAVNSAVADRQIDGWLNGARQTLQGVGPAGDQHSSAIRALDSMIVLAEGHVGKKETNSIGQKFQLRQEVQKIVKGLKGVVEDKKVQLSAQSREALKKDGANLQKVTDYAPVWVIATISLSLGLGTMIGWKRIVVTIGEKIGKDHLNYAQGATAEIVAAATIGLSTGFGLPVSTTHVLSSGVAGAMRASKGDNLNYKTLKNIVMAWVLTVPAAIGLGWLLFILLHWLFLWG